MHSARWLLLAGFLGLMAGAAVAQDAVPLDFARSRWIWGAGSAAAADQVSFRKRFDLAAPAAFARVLLTADGGFELAVNGTAVGAGSDWSTPQQFDVARLLRTGANVLAVKVRRGTSQAGLLLAARVVDDAGRLLDFASEPAWKAAAAGPAWSDPAADDARWAGAQDLGLYGVAPWGRLTRMSAAETDRAIQEIKIRVPDERDTHPTASAFAGAYHNPLHAGRFAGFFSLDRRTGRFQLGDNRPALCFVKYRQPNGAEAPPAFDFDLFESDLRILAASNLQVALGGFTWPDLLAPDGTWKPVVKQPKGAGLPPFKYAYQVVDRALDRIQAHGLHAVALLDLRRPLPAGILPEGYLDKVLLADPLWQGVVAGQVKIARYFTDRPVLVGYAAAVDALPAIPLVNEPLVIARYHEFLRQRHGDIETLRRAWGVGGGYPTFASIPLPTAAPTDPGAADFNRMRQWLVAKRLNEWADALHGVDAHHLLLVGDNDPYRPLFNAAWLRVDGFGTFGVTPRAGGGAMPGGNELAELTAYRQMPGTTLAGVLGGRAGGDLAGGYAARVLRHEWTRVIAAGGAGMIAAPAWDQLAGRGAMSADLVGVRQLGDLVDETKDFTAPAPATIAVVRSPAVAFSNAPAGDQAAVARVAEALDQAHLAYDIVTPDMLGGTDERYRTDAARYRAILLPSLAVLPKDTLWDRLQYWLKSGGDAPRVLVLGRWIQRNEYFQATSLPPALTRLTGGTTLVPAGSAAGRELFLGTPLAALPTGRTAPWPDGQEAAAVAVATQPNASVGYLRPAGGGGSGLPVLARLNDGRMTILVAGFELGFAGAEDAELAVASTLQVLRLALASGGVRPVVDAPPNVAVTLSADHRLALVAERLGQTSDQAWTGPADPPWQAWGDTTTRYDGRGQVAVQTSLAPYQLKVLRSVGELKGTADQAATVRVGDPRVQPWTVSGEGPPGLALALDGDPDRNYLLGQAGREAEQVAANSNGQLDVALNRGQMVLVSALPQRTPAPGRKPEEYLAVANYYISRGEVGRAQEEFARLQQQYVGTPVAALASQQQSRMLADCGAVVAVNYARMPMRFQYSAPGGQPTVVMVPPGQTVTVPLKAGDYQEQRFGPDGVALGGDKPTVVKVGKGEATIREAGIYLAGGTELDPKSNVRMALSDTEKQSLLSAAKGQVTAAPAAPVTPGGTAAEPAAAGSEAASKTTVITVDVQVKEPKQPKQPTPYLIKNQTTEIINIELNHFQVGLSPVNQSYQIKPRQRLNLQFADAGTYDISGKVASTGQDLKFGQYSATGKEYTALVREMTAEQAKREAARMAKQKQRELQTKQKPQTSAPQTSSKMGSSGLSK